MQRRYCRLGLVLLIIIACLVSTAAYGWQEMNLRAPQIAARGAALMDVNTGRLLLGKQENMRLPMASTTKIMTAILAIESGRLQEMVTVSDAATRVEPSSIWLVPGERISLHHLVYGLMLRSGNDAAVAIAEHLAGGVDEFAQLMNRKAQALGLRNTHFCNPHGLPHPEHYTTAYDLALLSAYALRNDLFTEVVSTARMTLPREQQTAECIWHNKNRLLQTYPGADGVKTGWTRAAGYCLVASANRAGFRLVAVVLNSPDDWGETAALLDYGFQHHVLLPLVTKGQYCHSAAVAGGYPKHVGAIAGANFHWPVLSGEAPQLEIVIRLQPKISAPVRAGQEIGVVVVQQSGAPVAEIPLLADQPSYRGRWRFWLHRLSTRFWQLLLQCRR